MIICSEPDTVFGSESDTDTDSDSDSDQEMTVPEKLLLPIHCQLVDNFVGDIKENLPTANM